MVASVCMCVHSKWNAYDVYNQSKSVATNGVGTQILSFDVIMIILLQC